MWVNEEYMETYSNDLIYLDDFVPPDFLTLHAMQERNKWIKQNNNKKLIDMNREYKQILALYEGEDRTNFIMSTMKEFIEKYPKFSALLKV